MTFAIPSTQSTQNETLRAAIQHALDNKTKPHGALGELERLALQLGLIQARTQLALHAPQLVVFAADHGLARRGVSAYPREVTPQMVLNFLRGGAAVSVLARQHAVQLTVVDCGVDHTFPAQAGLHIAKVRGAEHGTADASVGPAMCAPQCAQAMAQGAAFIKTLPGNALLLGEMGIGNTSSASLILSRLHGVPIADCVGRGTGLDEGGVAHKLKILTTALEKNASATDTLDVLAAFGGLEIATMVGAILQAASERRVIVVDGFITTAAVAIATHLAPHTLDYCVFAHCSAEDAHARWLTLLGVKPLLNLSLRLGEGSGAALVWPLLVSAVAILNEMASFAAAGVSEKIA